MAASFLHLAHGTPLPALPTAAQDMQEAPLWVQNTFLTSADARPPSLEEFYEARRVRSCPASCISEPCDSEEASEAPSRETCRRRPYYPGLRLVQQFRVALSREGRRPAGAVGSRAKDRRRGSASECSTAAPSSPASENDPALGSPELPSLGSAGHSTGQCKPCVFVGKRGCKSGAACDFCHLCGPGEKKRRQRERRALFASMKCASLNPEAVGSEQVRPSFV
uniref:C3H1-type domain-containing protein n=2 Tax=Alexandrium monilatum TaxID=311494 RepID=A0A7S4RJE7_9DINO